MTRQLQPRASRPIRLLAFLLAAGAGAGLAAAEAGPAAMAVGAPRLFPDYRQIVIPPGIAPLDFTVDEPGTRYRAEIRSVRGEPIRLSQRSASFVIPARSWRELLRANPGEPLYFDIAARDDRQQWRQFETVTNRIAQEEMDGHLAYRLLKPLYNLYMNVGIYQRELGSFEEKPILKNQSFGGGCLNCHTFLNRQPGSFALHVRTETNLHPMLLVRSNGVARVDKTMGYLSWHPSGRLLAFSANKLSMFFHTVGETRDVYDADSNLGIYRVDSNVVVTPGPIARPDRNETWPGWSPDGKQLYFSSAPKLPAERFAEIRYDLMRASFDIERNQWGEAETVVAAQETGLSATQPRVSPDGRWLLFCLSKYGNFPIYQPSSDLYLMDLRTRKYRRLEINSDQADSWHSWSSNSRWVVFSSKRIDGLFARPHFSHVDEDGRFSKPFVLPQKDPLYYRAYLNTVNVPEFIQGPVRVTPAALAEAVLRPRQVLAPQADVHREHVDQ